MTAKYFGVVGNRDHIKYRKDTDEEVKRHFWEYLDEQPGGWLTSLVYRRKELPTGTPLIGDCGAWSWKEEDVPHYRGKPVTAGAILEAYLEWFPAGAMVIAPDHMLIEKYGNMDLRRDFNRQMTRGFIELCPSTFTPMAAVHGLTLAERVERIEEYAALGYRHFALGGLAGQAGKKAEWFKQVGTIRRRFPHLYLHILGLSSPDYAAEWARIGVDSFDGSSHFKGAFTGGWYWYDAEAGKLEKHQAVGTGNDVPITIECDCRACALLREEGIDTRTFGSNENNMGRAAHNQNMLMRALKVSMNQPRTIALVSCVGEKKAHAEIAADLYQSQWFKKARAYAEATADQWYILSAEHGLVHPGEILLPYEATLNTMPKQVRRAWAHRTTGELLGTLGSQDRVVMLAGERYREGVTDALAAQGHAVDVPMQGLGIGQQLQWLTNNTPKEITQPWLF